MKVFVHKPLANPLPELTTQIIDGKRYYLTPEGNTYPSVTTVLSVLSKDPIEKWRQRIGEEEANRISEHAASRGTDLHGVIESYLNNEPITFSEDPQNRVRIMFNRMKRSVLNRVDNIIAQEVPLYSDKLRTAGRTDLVAEFDGVPSIVDFKGANKAKKTSWVTGYFLQTTAYSLMFEERTGIKLNQIVVLMCGEQDFSCQVFVEQRDKYIQKLEQTIDLFTDSEVA